MITLLCVPLFSCIAVADDAVLPNGKRWPGTLQTADDDRIVFAGKDGKTVPFDQLARVVFAEQPCPRPKVPISHRLKLSSRESLSGALIGLDEDYVRFRAFHGPELKITRNRILGITQPADVQVVSQESFEKDAPGWTLKNKPAAGMAFSGTKSLILDRPGQDTRWQLPTPLTQGRASFFVKPAEKVAGRELHIDWTFRSGKDLRHFELRLDGEKFFVPAQATPSLTAQSGWHWVQVAFGAGKVRLAVDDFVLLSETLAQDAALIGLAFSVHDDQGAKSGKGSWSVDDVQLVRPTKSLPWPRAVTDADAIWLADGDLLFGKVTRADGESATLEARYGTKTFPWPALRGVIFAARNPRKERSGHSLLSLSPGPGSGADQLLGKVLAVTPGKLTFSHDLFGTLEFNRTCCRSLAKPSP